MPVDVRPRPQDDVDPVLFGFCPHGGSHLPYEFGIPGGSQHGPDRKGRGIVGSVLAFTGRCYPQAGRSVREVYGGKSQPGCWDNGAHGPGNALARLNLTNGGGQP